MDSTPKEAAAAIHNLMAILEDPGASAETFTPTSLIYSLSGMPATNGNFVVHKSTGAFYIVLWNETQIWRLSSESQLSIPTRTVTVTLPVAPPAMSIIRCKERLLSPHSPTPGSRASNSTTRLSLSRFNLVVRLHSLDRVPWRAVEIHRCECERRHIRCR